MSVIFLGAILLVVVLIVGSQSTDNSQLRSERLFPAADQPPTTIHWDEGMPWPDLAEAVPDPLPHTVIDTEPVPTLPAPTHTHEDDQPTPQALTPEELDLRAQQRMAEAAWWSVGISVGSLVLAFASLVLINENLKEARKVSRDAARSANAAERAVSAAMETNSTAKEMAQKQLRAYCVVKSVILSADRVFAEVTITNSGQSPARHVTIKTGTSFPHAVSESVHRTQSLLPDLPSGAEDSVRIETADMGWDTGAGVARLVVQVSYLDVFDTWRQEEATFSVGTHRAKGSEAIEFDRAVDPFNIPRAP